MAFELPRYHAPNFDAPELKTAPDARWACAPKDGVAPDGYHSTSMYPEYFKIGGVWRLAEESRMDASVVLRADGRLDVVENRNLKRGDRVILGRTEKGADGIYLHTKGFASAGEEHDDQFVFRQGRSRETSYARDYDHLMELLRYEKEHGNILWVMGPAFAFDYDARRAMQRLMENGYAHGLLAGNALATHDLEGALLHTALGQDIYTQKSHPNGHYNHLDVINKVRASGSIEQFINDYRINLLNPLEITDFSKFKTGLKPLFEVLKNASDEGKLNDLITKDEIFTRVDVETVAAINLFAGTDIKYDEKEEVVNMCKAWDDHKKRGIQEGMKQGRCLEVYSLVQDGILDPEVGASRVSMSLDDFADAMQKAGYKLPEMV